MNSVPGQGKRLFCFFSKLKQAHGPWEDARTSLHKTNITTAALQAHFFIKLPFGDI